MMEHTCQVCKKDQVELSQPLKRCAKCLTGSYCSRDCQKADWKDHKKTCASQAANGATSTPASTESLLDTSGEDIDATYSMGCHDRYGNPLNDGLLVGQRRNRIFNPAINSNYNKPWTAPYELIHRNPNPSMNFLLLTMDDGSYDVERDTVVMEVGARKRLGLAVAARSFGKDSEFNATGMPEVRSTHNAISRSICIGCQSAGAVAEIWPALRRVIIMTSSNIICNGANKIFDWFKDGFPSSLPGGMTKEDWVLLHHNMKTLEDKGVAVKIWKVDPEYIVHATMLAWDRFIELGLAPADGPGICRCLGCVQKKQLTELGYARTGVVDCCDCPHAQSLIDRNLKRGDRFVITNNAGVTEPTTTMQVDGGGVFRDPVSSNN